MKNVQSYILNISYLESLDELLWYVENEYECDMDYFFDGDDSLASWTAPRWSQIGDIVLFMHSKTSDKKIKHIVAQYRRSMHTFTKKKQQLIEAYLDEAKDIYDKYGGKIFAFGTVCNHPYTKEDIENVSHSKSRVFAFVKDITLLQNPIDISEFKEYITLSTGGTITALFGESYNSLKQAIIEKNNHLPSFFMDSVSIPTPLKNIKDSNWIELSKDYRKKFFLESQLRSFYIDYFLKKINDSPTKTLYKECRCHNDESNGIVDYVIELKGRYLPVEAKLNVSSEPDIHKQLRKYTNLDFIELKAKSFNQTFSKFYVYNKVLVIDSNYLYMYFPETDALEKLYDLDNLDSEQTLLRWKEEIINIL